MSFNYKSLYKMFSILVVIQVGLVVFIFTRNGSITDKSFVEASINQNNIEYFETDNNQNSLQQKDDLKTISNLKFKLPILMYHHIDTIDNLPKTDKVGISLRVSPTIFEKQLQFLQKNNYNTINSFQLQEYLKGKSELPSNPIMLTFDDGYKDNYINAFPLLQKYKMVGDFAIITSVVGQNEYVSWENLVAMKNAGMSFASHTDHHCTTAIKNKKGGYENSPLDSQEKPCSKFGIQEKLSVGQIKYEFEKSKNDLEKNLDVNITHLVYPLGFYNKQAQEIAKNLGYNFATTVQPQSDNLVDFNNPFEVNRTRIIGQQSGELSGFFR
jgi:peptidoglycan/xylan/chitin deacetylase (PgdA/CDA1 family)